MATRNKATDENPVSVDPTDVDDDDTDAESADVDTDVDSDDDDSADDGAEGNKRRTRQPMPFGRPFGLTVKFHNDMPAEKREAITSAILGQITILSDGETLDAHRSTRGEENPNLQTWLVAPFGYDWPESSNKERGVRIPQGKLAEALRKYAAKNNVTMEKAAELFAEAFGIE